MKSATCFLENCLVVFRFTATITPRKLSPSNRHYPKTHKTQYFDKLDKLPIPPLLFYPEEEEAAAGRPLGVYESDLKKGAIRYYVIRGQTEDADLFVIAGLVGPAGLQVSVSFDVADMHLLSEYFHWALFERKDKQSILYSTIVDEVYDDIFRRHFIKTTDSV